MGNNPTHPFKLPDDIIESVRQLLEETETYQWALGRYLVDVVDEFGLERRPEVIRQLANGTGAHPSTLRDRETVCRFYSPDEQSEFTFGWSQWRALKSAGREHWREHAEYWAGNLPAPVSAIRSRIKKNGHESSVWEGRWEMILHMVQLLLRDKDTPVWIKTIARLIKVW